MKTPAALFFDNDGVLLDSESEFFALTHRLFAAHGLNITSELWLHHYLGKGLRTSQIAVQLGMEPDTAQRLATQRDRLWYQRLKTPIQEIPGISALIQKLADRGHRMAIVTGAPRSHFAGLHQHTNLLRHFEFHITHDECPRVKPLPDAYLQAAARMKKNPEDCIAIEDSPRGVRAALDAGMRCALLVHALTDLKHCPAPTWIAHSVNELRVIAQTQWNN